jgi:hypothetical protein
MAWDVTYKNFRDTFQICAKIFFFKFTKLANCNEAAESMCYTRENISRAHKGILLNFILCWDN